MSSEIVYHRNSRNWDTEVNFYPKMDPLGLYNSVTMENNLCQDHVILKLECSWYL